MSTATKIAAAVAAMILLLVIAIIGSLAALLGAGLGGTSAPSQTALTDIPPEQLALYQQAATVCPGLDWTVLAAIGKVESDHGRSTLRGVHTGENPYRAAGPMQIIPTTWDAILARHQIPPGGATPPSRYNPHDAIHAAAFLLCDNDARTDLRGAVFAYNHADWYVDHVLARADDYRSITTGTGAQTRGWTDEQATLPDPTGTGGQLTPRMNTLYQTLAAAGATRGGATCWDPHLHNPTSDHPRGKACDLFYKPNDPADVAYGWTVANWLTTAQATYGIRNIIWQGQIWSARSPTWSTYNSDVYNCPDPANLTGCHYDHIHVSVF
ncbi:lytic transglycosylase domain-containing protein [Pseudonocardia sichuanensis]|uniref:Transglycosylase-like protein with SLT domain n=1 Tax=Pseudonocardia kunmingensis TaxID=630975 RepID=A0A543D9H8_9PSEU|nr:lytic transglycosylase domain-containing protein [Pseudonocardia kunmingensis]TQM05997.1 transglycosylase-like protein with SLT domain [Pseudonocardia kunmingensis]